MKVHLAYIFLFIFSFQVLPVKELGQMLFKGTMTEEVHEVETDGGDDIGYKLKKDPTTFTHNLHIASRSKALTCVSKLACSKPQPVSKQYSADVLTPPPNVA